MLASNVILTASHTKMQSNYYNNNNYKNNNTYDNTIPKSDTPQCTSGYSWPPKTSSTGEGKKASIYILYTLYILYLIKTCIAKYRYIYITIRGMGPKVGLQERGEGVGWDKWDRRWAGGGGSCVFIGLLEKWMHRCRMSKSIFSHHDSTKQTQPSPIILYPSFILGKRNLKLHALLLCCSVWLLESGSLLYRLPQYSLLPLSIFTAKHVDAQWDARFSSVCVQPDIGSIETSVNCSLFFFPNKHIQLIPHWLGSTTVQ